MGQQSCIAPSKCKVGPRDRRLKTTKKQRDLKKMRNAPASLLIFPAATAARYPPAAQRPPSHPDMTTSSSSSTPSSASAPSPPTPGASPPCHRRVVSDTNQIRPGTFIVKTFFLSVSLDVHSVVMCNSFTYTILREREGGRESRSDGRGERRGGSRGIHRYQPLAPLPNQTMLALCLDPRWRQQLQQHHPHPRSCRPSSSCSANPHDLQINLNVDEQGVNKGAPRKKTFLRCTDSGVAIPFRAAQR